MTRQRIPVELHDCTRLLDHGPTALVTSAHGGRSNVISANRWHFAADPADRTIHHVAGGHFFATG